MRRCPTQPVATSQPLRFDPSADEILLPSEPPAPAARNGASDLEVDDIRRLVQEAWDDETAIGRPDIEPPADTASAIQADDPDIESAMEDIAAAVGQSGDPAVVNLEELKAELVTAMRAELQAVVETDLKAMVKAVVAEALKDMPAPKPATRAKKAAATKGGEEKDRTGHTLGWPVVTSTANRPTDMGKSAPCRFSSGFFTRLTIF